MRIKKFFSPKWLILILLILALLVTAINASVMSSRSDVVVSVGAEKISVDDFVSEYKKHERYFQSMFGFGLTDKQLKDIGVGRIVLTTLIQDKVIEQLFKQMGLYIDTSIAIEKIKKNPAFNENGKFDRAKLDDFLDRNDLTEREYIRKVKREIGKDFVFGPFFHIQGEYRKLAELFYNFEYGLREVSVTKVNKNELPAPPVATESELVSFYEENKDKFFSDEYRAAEYVLISEDTVKPELVEIADEDVQKSFDDLQLGKRYYVNYLELDSRDEAERMKKSVAANPEFYANDLTHIEGVVKADLPAFLPKNIKWDGNKWFIAKYMGKFYVYTVVKIVSVSPVEKEKNFDELRKFMRLSKLNQIIDEIRSEVHSGEDWKAIVEKYGGEIDYLPPVCRLFLDKEGRKVEVSEELLEQVFASDEGNVGETVTSRNEFILFRVTSIEPVAKQPFNKVRGKVMKALSKKRQMQVALELLQKRRESGERTEKVLLYRPEVAKRKKLSYHYPDEFVAEVFQADSGGTTKVFESDEEFFFGKVLGNRNPELDESKVAEIEAKLREEIGFSILSELSQAAMKQFKVKVNSDLVKDLL
ncbi:SurA N-terminal domain-containing protein [Neorickettsia sp. 179522]|uniref:SurA N-terminal domain-containing protein n=1 Tax=Neorickettsia sp. 179522 TaxID=1714371 RepID=UPI000A852150|nr:SurA N-terminal domain-containing protein [Neorickettsia sp. 179522]